MVTLTLTDSQAKTFSKLLELCSQNFSYRICNDVDPELVSDLSKAEIQQMEKEFQQLNGTPEEYDQNHNIVCNYDWALVSYFRMKLNREIKNKEALDFLSERISGVEL